MGDVPGGPGDIELRSWHPQGNLISAAALRMNGRNPEEDWCGVSRGSDGDRLERDQDGDETEWGS